jgi:hypothetical protein
LIRLRDRQDEMLVPHLLDAHKAFIHALPRILRICCCRRLLAQSHACFLLQHQYEKQEDADRARHLGVRPEYEEGVCKY